MAAGGPLPDAARSARGVVALRPVLPCEARFAAVCSCHSLDGAERFDYLGEVRVWLRDLSAAFLDADAQWTPPGRAPLLEAELRVPVAPMTLWEELTSPANRAQVAFCAADRLASVEEIVEWRPFSAYARIVKLPGARRLTARHELEPDGEATRLRVRWWGASATSDEAQREHDRLRLLVT